MAGTGRASYGACGPQIGPTCTCHAPAGGVCLYRQHYPGGASWACCGAGCWRKVSIFTLPTARFSWTNEAKGKAAVHCVIVGFGLQDVAEKTIFEYADIKGEALAVPVSDINPYLVDAPDIQCLKSEISLSALFPRSAMEAWPMMMDIYF